ncbi:MAG: sugar transferase [Candidatus Spechtbacterales bacterium]|nr:sugar transferase [Candidatus Spechtbacterales bacterium]
MRKNDLAYNLILLPLDFVLILAAAFAAYFLRLSPLITDIKPVLFNLTLGRILFLTAAVAAFLLILFALSGLYHIKRTTPVLAELARIIISISAGMALIIVFMFFRREWFDSRFILLGAWVFAILFVALGRMTMRAVRRFILHKNGVGLENILILGRGEEVELIKKQISQNKKLGLRLADVLANPDLEVIRGIHASRGIHRVLAADTDYDRLEIMKVVNFCEENGIQFSYVPDMLGSIVAEMSFDLVEGVPVVSVKPSPLDGWAKVSKRIIDIILSAIGLIILSPLFFFIALAIKWETEGPVLVKLKRVSRGKEFDLYKFRSMIKNAHKYKKYLKHMNEREDGPLFKLTNDPRVTRVGKFLRARRLDEIPQLINVFKGDISLVGPRPHEPEEIERYEDYHKKVLAIKSGLSGMAQVSGAHDLPFEEEVKLDRYYIENWSLKLDFVIMLKTIKLLLFDKSGI